MHDLNKNKSVPKVLSISIDFVLCDRSIFQISFLNYHKLSVVIEIILDNKKTDFNIQIQNFSIFHSRDLPGLLGPQRDRGAAG